MERLLPGIIESKTRVPPERDGMVRRSRLLEELSTTQATVVLVRAPAGFGKSTVLEQWAHSSDRRFAWVSLDPSEGDSTLFWRYVYTAIRACIPGFASHLFDEIAKPEPDLIGSVIPGLLNELAALDEPLVLVLDDYHRMDSPDVDRTIELFIRRLPRGVTVAIGSRLRPQLEVARMRSRGLVHDVHAADLSLTVDDAAAVLRAQKPERTDDEVAWIHSITEGWPAGVYLFGLVEPLDRSARTTSDIRDYLVTEMFSSLAESDLQFMRETSILARLEAGFCDYVTRGDSGQARLERISRSNLLILPLDQAGDQFRYHHLLQAELNSLLERQEPPGVIASLHRRAMEWTADHGYISEAVQHAVRAGDIEAAVGLVSAHWYEFLMTGRGREAYQWIGDFSDHDRQGNPQLALAAAMIAAVTGHSSEARAFAATAEAASSEGEGLIGASSYESSVAIMRASIAADGPVSALIDARRASELEPLESPYRPLLAVMSGTFTFCSEVQDADAYPLLLEGTRAATGPPEVAAYALGSLALLHAWRNDREVALSYARQSIQKTDKTSLGGLVLYGVPYAIAAGLSVGTASLAECRLLMRSAEQAERTASDALPFDSMVLRTAMAEAYTSMEEFGQAREYARRALANLSVMTEGGLVATRLDTVIRLINRADPESDGQSMSTGPLLSPREIQILSLLTTDETLEEIGHHLYISRNTVKTHIRRIYRKLGVSDRQQAIAVARGLSLV